LNRIARAEVDHAAATLKKVLRPGSVTPSDANMVNKVLSATWAWSDAAARGGTPLAGVTCRPQAKSP